MGKWAPIVRRSAGDPARMIGLFTCHGALVPDTEDGIGAGAQVAPSAHHSNNFDFLRWLAASMVLTSHEFAVLRGGNGEPVARLTDGFATLGTLGVDAFFVISGYLVCASMMRGAAVPFFVAARALRLMPGLCVALLVSALVIGAAATTLPLADYWRAPETWSYIVPPESEKP